MWLKKIKTNNFLIPLGLVLIGVIVYHFWFSFHLFFYGDWSFSFKEYLVDNFFPSAAGIWGGPWLWKYPYLFLQGIFGLSGFASNISDKFLIFWQIAFLTPLAGFFLVRKITNSSLSGFIGSLIFSYNTYFLSIDTQGHELLTVAFTWGAIALLSFICFLDSKRKIFIPITSLLLLIVGFYDFRSLYIVVLIIFLYSVYHQIFLEKKLKDNLGKNIVGFISIFFGLFILNLYWLLPNITANVLTQNEFLIRGVFGSEYYNLQNSLAFFYPFWTGKETTWLYLQKIPLYFWLYPLLAFSGLIVGLKNKRIAFFGMLAIIGIFLTKQEGQPFGFVYVWLFNHIPGFSAFREASKFDFITAISYSVLIGAFALYLWNYIKDKRLKYFFIFLIALFPLWNTKPLITGEIKTMFVPYNLPSDFGNLDKYISNDKSYSRVLGVSMNKDYIFSTGVHPEIDFLNSLAHFWGGDLVSYNFEDRSQTEGDKLIRYLASDEGRRLLSASSVGYLPVFIEDASSYQSIRRDLGEDRTFFEKSIGNIKYLDKIDIGLKNIILYKNLNYKPHLYTTKEKETLRKDISYEKIDFQMINSSEYTLTFKNLKTPVFLNFTDLYAPEWKIHVGEFKWWKVLFDKNYFLSDSFHSQSAIRFNQFLIDPIQICSVNACTVNADGSYNFQATLYSRPQSYLYLGLILSGVGFVIVAFGIFYFLKKGRNEK